MIKFMRRIPAGTFIVPMVVSMVIYSFFPSLFNIGGPTEAFFSNSGTNYIVGLLVFASGTTVDLKKLGHLMKHQGALVLIKMFISIIFGTIFLLVFGLDGVWGISGLGFLAVILSINPAVHLALTEMYGDKDDASIYPFAVIPALPALPMIMLSAYISGGFGGIEWTPIISIFLPLVIGIILGNLDPEFGKVFGPVMPAALMLLGWLLGQGMDMFEAIRSGISGIIVTIIFMVLSMPLMYFIDKKILKYDGLAGVSIATVAGMSTAVPTTVGAAIPAVAGDVTSATAQVLMAAIITSILAPIIVDKLYQKKD
ncbi:2-keto-3-deoxygluconate permease [Aerococcus sp. HMSC10H05]|uniref:2-keto-3-deoxygluconate permease n=1 Tax=Aerococcus sp. HMSC10H05 TaxID=1581084 RepID=UPI0008A55F9A|nr:2-keto-3-deoxygluconate permease [Aerococcus sp. HMSC10H05]OFU49659.1 hypothetical protein HMPREF3116_06885 [Aerococcus sp. HMSC10H05]